MVTVLCPNGRRQQVKVIPNTKILEIIEEVCKKQGFNPNEYELYHQRRSLDITLAYRLTGCPKNAHFDLKKLETGPRQFNDVTILLQLEDGTKLTPKTFKPDSTNLTQIIESYLTESNTLHQVFEDKSLIDNPNHPCCVYLNEQVVGLYQMSNTTLKDLGLTNGRGIIRLSYRSIDKDQFESLNNEFKQKLDKKLKLDEQFQIKVKENEENELKSEIISEASSITQLSPMSVSESEVNLVKKQKIETMDYEPIRSNVTDMQVDTIETKIMNPVVNEFANFKFPEETKGQKLNDLNDMKEYDKLSREPCDREMLMFSLEKSTVEVKNDELPEDFFDVTVNDLRYMIADLKRLQSDEQPLMTKQMREYQREKQAMKYSKVVIRICFKDRRVLQGLFRPKETIAALYDFVKLALSHENSELEADFYLYSTPPKNILTDMKKSLFDSQLCPAVLIYFKNKSDSVPTFASNIKEASLDEANKIVDKEVHQTTRAFDDDEPGADLVSKEATLTKNILKSTSYKSNQPDSEGTSSSTGRVNKSEDNEFNRKLGRFLGSKK